MRLIPLLKSKISKIVILAIISTMFVISSVSILLVIINNKNNSQPSIEQELENQLFFFEVERRRMRKATKLALEGKNVILDTRTKELSKRWVDSTFTDYQNEFYETISKKIPHSKRISTTGKAKDYVSTIIAQILNVAEIDFKEL